MSFGLAAITAVAFADPPVAEPAPGAFGQAPAGSADTFTARHEAPAVEDAPVALGPTFGGGMLVGVQADFRLTQGVYAQLSLGFRPGFTLDVFYPNVAAAAGVTAAWGVKKVRSGVYASVAASAPVEFFDAWVSAGYALEARDSHLRRVGVLHVGPALYLAREMPEGVAFYSPVFVYVSYTFPIELGSRTARKPV